MNTADTYKKQDDEGNELPLSVEQVEQVVELINEALARYRHPSHR